MMKKILIAAAAAGVCLNFSGCGEKEEEDISLVTIERTEYAEKTDRSFAETFFSEENDTPDFDIGYNFAVPSPESSAGTVAASAPETAADTVFSESDVVMTRAPFSETESTVTARNLLSENGGSDISENDPPPSETSSGISYSPRYYALNYPIQRGMWFSYLEYDRIMKNHTADQFTAYVEEAFDNMAAIGINTVYVHLRPFGDAYYKSDIFPKGDRLTGSYDPLEIMIKAAHDRGLSVHGWINPMRLMTDNEMNRLSGGYKIKQWYSSGTNMYRYDGRWYLDPSSSDARGIICAGASEILEKYDVDGIQIDDYFYPTDDLSWDMKSYENSDKSLSHEEFRREAVTLMVKELYSAVHRTNSSAVFGISPMGNAEANYTRLFADTSLWCGRNDCCDYICPQIYFGMEHETYPFEGTLGYWRSLCCEDVSLVAGIGAYKAGTVDSGAGSGAYEWVNNSDIITREIEISDRYGCGYALFRYDTLFEGTDSAREELENITRIRN